MLATPAGLTVVTFLSLRMRPEALRPVKWRLAEWPRRILPPAVTLKRLRTPRCVFNFILGFDAFLGISKTFLLPLQLSRRAEQRFLTSLCLPQTGSNDRRDHAPERVPRYSAAGIAKRSEEHTSELQSRGHLVCRLLLEKKKTHQ